MASRTRSIVTAVKAALAGINGTGAYVHNVAATGKVLVGRPTPADGPSAPCIWVAIGTVNGEHAPQLGRYTRRLVLDIEARAPANADTTEERGFIATDLLDDICTALEADRSWGGLAIDTIVTGGAVDGDEAGLPGMAVAIAEVEIYWFADSAAGV